MTDTLAEAYAAVSATVGLAESPRPEDVRGARPLRAVCKIVHTNTPPPLTLPHHTQTHTQVKAAGVQADAAAAKPKARDIQRFLAVASAMVGDELEEGISTAGGAAVAAAAAAVAARRDGAVADSVLSLRERVKLDSMATVREGRAKAELASARDK